MDATTQPKTAMDPDREKFVAAVQPRVNKAIKAIRLIGKLDARGSYTSRDIENIFDALGGEISAMSDRLMKGIDGAPDFRLYDGAGDETDYTRG